MAAVISSPKVHRTGIFTAVIFLLSMSINSCFTGAPVTVYGEFHDAFLMSESIEQSSEKASWTDEELFDGGSGATIQAKTFGHPVGKPEVQYKGRVIATADGWGQFHVKLKPGTYLLTGVCPGYRSRTVEITVESGKKTYANFILEPDEQ